MTKVFNLIFQKFDLSSTETKGVDLNEEDIERSIEECRLSLIGKYNGKKTENFSGIKNFTNHVWGYPRNLRVIEFKANTFQFHFDNEKALHRRPWVMDNQLLVVKHWGKGMEHDPSAFTSAYLWMHVWNLLVHWLSRSVRFK